MTALSAVVSHYVTLKRSMAMRFNTEAVILKAYSTAMGAVDVTEVDPRRCKPISTACFPLRDSGIVNMERCAGCIAFAIGRNYLSQSPLPAKRPQPVEHFTPYIYSKQELRSLLQASQNREDSHIAT